MRLAWIAAAAATAAAGLLAASAWAGTAPDEHGVAYVEELAYEQSMSAAGRPLGPKVLVARVQYAPGPAAAGAGATRGRVGVSTPVRALQASGCKNVWAARVGKSLLGFTIWKYTQEKYFCWTSPRLTNVQTNAYPCCTDPTWHWVGQVGSAGWFFSFGGDSRGGHYSFRQGRLQQTIAGRLLDSAQPWVKLWVYSNGGWSYATGS